MARVKFDGLIEAVRYLPDGEIEQVRIYLRRGPTFSDHKLMSRDALLEFLKNGNKAVTGSRQELMASTFTVEKKVHLVKASGEKYFIATEKKADKDMLEGTPLF